MAKNRVHNEIDSLETTVSSQSSAISSLQSSASTAAAHIALVGNEGQAKNPHGVTAADVGAPTTQDLANAIAGVVQALDWKEMVATFEDLATTYPSAEEGWTASVAADNLTYRYNGSEWVGISGGTIPLATINNDGLLSKEDFDKLAGIEAGAEVNQTDSEIKTAYENNDNTNAFTDAEKTKLGGIESNANNYVHPANHPATFITYDNQESTLTSTALQGAIDELDLKKLDRTELGSSIVLYPTDTVLFTDGVPYFKLVDDLNDPDYDSISVDITTPEITGVDQLVASLSTVPGVLIGNPGIFTANTIGLIRKASGNDNQKARFYYKIFKRNSLGAESEVAVSDPTPEVTSITFEEFNASALFNNGDFTLQDRIVIKYYASVVDNPGATYQFQFGGTTPIRTLLPVPIKAIPAEDASGIVTDTSTFNAILSVADNTVQKALVTLDNHNHDSDYVSPQQLSDAITSAELALGTNFAVANIAARDALEDLTVGDQVFVTDDGDTKWAIYKVTGVGPNVFTKIMDQDLFTNAIDAAAIKASYESNANTNVFTDSEKTKVSNLEYATQQEAEAGLINTKYMNPLLTAQAIEALSSELATVLTSETPPLSPNNGDLWWDTTTGFLFVYYDDGSSAQWIEALASLDDASGIDFDNSPSSLTSINVQDALVELNGDVNGLSSTVGTLVSTTSQQQTTINDLDSRVRLAKWSGGFFNNFTFIEDGQQYVVEDYSDIAISLQQRDDGLNSRITTLENAPAPTTMTTVRTTVPANAWNGSAAPYTNIVTLPGATITSQTEEYAFNFGDNEATANDFPNLPPQTMTFSSTSTTGPVTLTKTLGGDFDAKYIGSLIQVNDVNGGVIYVITEIVDANTLTVYYQPGASQGNVLSQTSYDLYGQTNDLRFFFAFLNGTGPNPEDPKVLQINSFEQQTSQVYGIADAIKGASMNKNFTVPTDATAITALRELDTVSSFGNRYYALIYDNTVAYVANGQGIRKIAKIENGNTFINVANTYLAEDWSQAGGNLQFITPFAIQSNILNAVTPSDWANATEFLDVTGVSTITVSIGLSANNINESARTPGIELDWEVTQLGDIVFVDEDEPFVDLDINSQNFANYAAFETAWDLVKVKGNAIGNNTMIFVASDVPQSDIPVRIRVIK